MDKVRAAVGPEPFLVYNGLFLSGGGVKLAGADYLSHASAVYAESLSLLSSSSSSLSAKAACYLCLF